MKGRKIVNPLSLHLLHTLNRIKAVVLTHKRQDFFPTFIIVLVLFKTLILLSELLDYTEKKNLHSTSFKNAFKKQKNSSNNVI